jgi:Xaa-Pro aminopeptidase
VSAERTRWDRTDTGLSARYHVQAAKELDPNWTLFKVGLRDVDDWYQYLTKARPSSSYETASNTYIQQLPTSSKIGLDPSLFSTTSISALTSTLQLVFPSANLIDTIWTSRPPRSSYPITLHSLEFSGCSTSDKLSNLRGLIPEGQSYLLASLPNIAWFLNMRGSDIPFNPVFYAYVLVDKDSLIVWAQEASVDKEVRSAVEELGGKVEDYEGVWDSLKRRKVSTASLAVGSSTLTPVLDHVRRQSLSSNC